MAYGCVLLLLPILLAGAGHASIAIAALALQVTTAIVGTALGAPAGDWALLAHPNLRLMALIALLVYGAGIAASALLIATAQARE